MSEQAFLFDGDFAEPKQNSGNQSPDKDATVNGPNEPVQVKPAKSGLPSAVARFLAADHDLPTDLTYLQIKLERMPTDGDRLSACESALTDVAGPLLSRHTSRALRAGILVSLVTTNRWQDDQGNALIQDVSAYTKDLFQRMGVGSSPGQLSRNTRAGELALKLHKRDLPVPETAEPLTAILPLRDQAESGWEELCKKAGGLPETKIVKAYVRDKRGLSNTTPKKITAAPVIATCTELLALIPENKRHMRTLVESLLAHASGQTAPASNDGAKSNQQTT